MRCADADISLRQSKQSMLTGNLSCQPSKKNENKSCNTRSFDYTEAMKEKSYINPEIQALLDRMVKRTEKNIEIMREQLKRERKQDEQNRKEINEALKKLAH